jgi:serine/threonine-protein kinase HipA
MSRNSTIRPDTLAVRLNERLVGTLTRLPDETIVFAFDPNYEQDRERPVLSLSYKTPDGGLVLGRARTGTRLLPFFSNLLPEGHLRDYLARKLAINTRREFFLLGALGLDLPGAVIVEPLGELSQTADREHSQRDKQDSPVLRFSLAGVQLKFSAVAEAQGTFTIPANGAGGSWIVKLPSATYLQLPETEFSMLTLARQIGITVPEFQLVPTSSIEGLPGEFRNSVADSLAVKRFDRTASGGRIHMEDFAQVYGVYPEDKYEKAGYAHIARVLWMEDGESSFTEFVRRLVFTVAIGNGDMHLKNWTLLYLDPCRPVLSPAYDFVPTIAYMEKDSLALNLGGSKNFRDVTVEKFKKMATQAKASERLTATIVNETVERIQDTWNHHRPELRLPSKTAKTIDRHMASLPLLKARRNFNA